MGLKGTDRCRILSRAVLFTVLITVLSTDLLLAQSVYRTDGSVQVSESDTLSRQLFAAGEWIEIAGVLENDLFAAGRQVSIDGTVMDDAFIAGESVTVNGFIGDMLATMAESLVLDGNVAGDVFAMGRVVRLNGKTTIGGNLFIGAQDVQIDGSEVSGNALLAANRVHLNSRFGGHVTIYGSNITFGPDYYSSKETKIVSSEPIYRDNLGEIPERLTIEVQRPPYLPVFLFQVWFYLSLLLTGIVLLLLFRKTAEDMQRFAVERFWKNTLTGLLLFLLVPIALLLLMVPLITIPLVALTGILYLVVLFTSYLFTAMVLGLQIILWFKKEATPPTYYFALALGLIVIAAMNNLPVLGPLFSIFLLFFGLGSFAAYVFMRYKYPADINEFKDADNEIKAGEM